MIRSLLLFTLILPALSWANPNCTPVDYRNRLGAVRDQGGMGWCASFAAADMITFNLGRRVSAMGVALAHNNSGMFTVLRGRISGTANGEASSGNISVALNAAFARGMCFEADLPSNDPTHTMYQKLHAISNYKREFDRTRHLSEAGFQSARILYPKLNDEEIYAIIEYSSIANVHEMLALVNCRRNKPQPKRFRLGLTYSPLASFIDYNLNKGKIVAINYSSLVLQNIDHAGKYRDGHISTIVGRRFNERSRKCEYLVRNSWGPDCGKYDRRLNCENGHIWVPSQMLLSSSSELYYY